MLFKILEDLRVIMPRYNELQKNHADRASSMLWDLAYDSAKHCVTHMRYAAILAALLGIGDILLGNNNYILLITFVKIKNNIFISNGKG